MKVFCIGFNKTGTTSLSKIFSNNNFLVAPQTPFECNTDSYIYGYPSTIIEMIKNDYFEYSFFQDVPFSLPNFYENLFDNFPNAKFILTVRDNENDWYDSLIRFHKKFANFKIQKKFNICTKGGFKKFRQTCMVHLNMIPTIMKCSPKLIINIYKMLKHFSLINRTSYSKSISRKKI